MNHLVHKTLLSVTVSILHWVETVKERWLGLGGGAVVAGRAAEAAGGASGADGASGTVVTLELVLELAGG